MRNIFLIEDDVSILYGLRDIFASNDHQVAISDASEDVEEIINKLKKFKPDIIILDLVLPKIDGNELIKKIKEDDVLSQAEIFIFSDLSDGDGQSRSVGLGANYYFLKNEFDIYTFANKVMRMIAREDRLLADEDLDDSDDLVMD